MRSVGFGMLGFLCGAVLGLIAAVLLLFLIYDVLGLASHGADGLSGFGSFMLLGPLLALGGGIAGAIWFARRAGSGGGAATPLIAALLLVAALFLFLGFSPLSLFL